MFIYVTLSKLMTNGVALFVDIFGVNLLLSKNTSDNQHIMSVNYIWCDLISGQWVTPSSICVVLIQEYNLLCSLSGNKGLLKTVEAAEVLGSALAAMTRLCKLE